MHLGKDISQIHIFFLAMLYAIGKVHAKVPFDIDRLDTSTAAPGQPLSSPKGGLLPDTCHQALYITDYSYRMLSACPHIHTHTEAYSYIPVLNCRICQDCGMLSGSSENSYYPFLTK